MPNNDAKLTLLAAKLKARIAETAKITNFVGSKTYNLFEVIIFYN